VNPLMASAYGAEQVLPFTGMEWQSSWWHHHSSHKNNRMTQLTIL